MKKKIILGVVAAVVVLAAVLAIAGVSMMKAPELNMDGSYVALDGSTLTVSGDTFTCTDAPYSGTVERVERSVDYIFYHLPEDDNAQVILWVDGTLKTADNELAVSLAQDGDVKFVAIYQDGAEPVCYFPTMEQAEELADDYFG